MELLKAIATRKAVRAFQARQIDDGDLNTILAAGCAAPVGMNAYDNMHFTVIQQSELLEKIEKAAAKVIPMPGFSAFYGAPTVVIVSAKPSAMVPNLEYANAACMIENMLLAATDLGLGSIYLWGFLVAFDSDADLKQQLDLPADFNPVSAAAFGYAVQTGATEKELTVSVGTRRIR